MAQNLVGNKSNTPASMKSRSNLTCFETTSQTMMLDKFLYVPRLIFYLEYQYHSNGFPDPDLNGCCEYKESRVTYTTTCSIFPALLPVNITFPANAVQRLITIRQYVLSTFFKFRICSSQVMVSFYIRPKSHNP
jgi:hypothetical protein